MEISISATLIDTMLWHIQREIMDRHGYSASQRMMAPLTWYINTGRASLDFLKALYQTRPVLVARDLAKGGSDDEIIRRICKRIKYEAC